MTTTHKDGCSCGSPDCDQFARDHASDMSVEEIRQRMGSHATTEQAERMLDLLVYSEYADTPTTDIPEREWWRLCDIACE